ncbi:MAG: TonB-dependent receptor [Terracidiphilus sp.]
MERVQFRQAERRIICALLFVFGYCCVFSGRVALSQVDEGAITGVVKDTSGAVIPNAEVTLTNPDTDFMLQGKSNGVGFYSFAPIKIGRYKLSASVPGFETTTQENITVNIQDRLNIDITLKPGAVNENVTVTSAPPLIQTESSTVGQSMSTDAINATPLNGRNWVYIAQLAAGVDPSFANGTARGGGTGDFSANGQRTTQNNFILDGVDNNVNVDDFQNGTSYNVRPPPDALQEFNISTSNYSAEFGHSAGAVLNASIKAGTNQIHGDLWEYVRNTALDAQDWDATSIPAYHENQFGATFGLPIWKNKIFYFGDAEANRIAFAQPSPGLTVPTASMRKGDFSEFFNTALTGKSVPVGVFAPNTAGELPLTQTGGAFPNPNGSKPGLYPSTTTCSPSGSTPFPVTCPALSTTNVLTPGEPLIAGGSSGGQMSTVATEILAAYPKPNAGGWTAANYNTPGSGLLYNNYSPNLPVHDDTWQWDQRVDWNISAKDQTFARYSYTHDQVIYTAPLGPIIDGGNDVSSFHGATNFNLAQNFMASETHIFAPNLVNEFRFGYNWGNYQFLQSNPDTPASSLIPGMGGVPFTGYPEPNGGLPYIPMRGSVTISAAGARHDVPSVERQNIYQILDNVTKVFGSHSLKFGMQLESIRTSFSQAMYPRGRYSYSGEFSSEYGVGNTGGGVPDLFTDNMGNVGLSPGWNTSYYRWYRSAYAQDDWRVNSRLTLNLGVRYDYILPVSSKPGDVANFVIDQTGLTAEGAGTNAGSAAGKGVYELSSKVQSQNLLPPNFTTLLAGQNISTTYLSNNSLSLVSSQKDNFAPRIGFSFQPDPKTVVRAGYGIFYGAIEAPGGAELTVNYPFSYTSVLYNAYLGSGACLPSAEGGASNPKSQCPSTGVPNTSDGSELPYAADLETGMSSYLSNGGIANYAGEPGINMSDPNPKTPYTESYNLSFEREVSTNLLATVGYVGNTAKHTYAGTNPIGSSLAVTNAENYYNTSPFPGVSQGTGDEQYIGESMYNGLQTKLEKRYSGGLSYLATYTWSHAEDDASNPGIGGGPGYRNTTLIPLKYEFTNANYDARHRVTVNGMYDLPFGKGRKYLRVAGPLDYLVGGWSTSLTWAAQTGNPITISPGGNFVPANGYSQINAIPVGDPFKGGGSVPAANPDTGACPTSVKNRTNWYNPCAFVDPVSGLDPSLVWNEPGKPDSYLTGTANAIKYFGGKSNQIYGPGYERINMSGFKNFGIWREQYIQFRADAFNLFNHPSWNSPSDTSLNPTGGQITSVQNFQNYTPDARFFQLAAKYVF